MTITLPGTSDLAIGLDARVSEGSSLCLLNPFILSHFQCKRLTKTHQSHGLTYLTSKGLSDAQIQLISGHESKKSLEVYQHLSLESVDKAYQDAVQSMGI